MTHEATALARAYDLSVPHPNIPRLIESMSGVASMFRSEHPPAFSPVGLLNRPIDVFVPDGPIRGAVAMVHGGYWVRGAPTDITHLATGALANGIAVGFVPYGLCPEFTIGDAIGHTIDATRIIGSTVAVAPAVFGHSAGGHLAASVIAAGGVADAVFVSGLYDLAPIVEIPLNDTLGLTEQTARQWSPTHTVPPSNASITAFVGEHEPSGFLDQQEVLRVSWGGRADVRTRVLAGGDHFSEIATLVDPDSPLTGAVVAAALDAESRQATGSGMER